MQYDLATGRTRALYRGLAYAYTPYGAMVLFTGLVANAAAPKPTDTGPPLQLYAIDQDNGKAITAPSGISAAADGNAVDIESDGDLVVWNKDGAVRAWRRSWGRSITLVPDPATWPEGNRLHMNFGGYLRIYRHFLIWATGAGVSVLDLTTDTFANLPLQGHAPGLDVSGSMLAVEAYTHQAIN